MAIRNRFTQAYNVQHPFVVAGLGLVGMTPELAVAACEAGAIGSVGIGAMPPPAMRQLIQAVRAQTSAPFNVNMLTLFAMPEHIDVCVAAQPPIVSFHWGHPGRSTIERLHAAGCEVWEQVGSTEAAQLAASDGIDVLVAQGSEAGGHNYGQLPTFVQVPTIVDAVAYPGAGGRRGLGPDVASGRPGPQRLNTTSLPRHSNVMSGRRRGSGSAQHVD